MQKSEAIKALGGSVADAAREIGVTFQAVNKWPEELPARIRDRVQAALYRKERRRPAPAAPPKPSSV